MLTNRKRFAAAILVMAVVFISLGLGGCATKRNMDELMAEVREVKRQNDDTQETLARLDSLVTAGTDADNKMRNDISTTVYNLQEQLDVLMENYNDLMTQIQQLGRQPSVTHVIRPSPGASDQTPVTITDTAAAPADEPPVPAIDCDAAYDESFILVRGGQYEKAIQGFDKFLANCGKHESVENAYYWKGECFYSLEKYVDAIAQFQFLIDTYKSTVNASRAMYKLARSQQELGKINEAKRVFQKLVDEYPESLEASQAKERLKDLQ